MPLFPEFEPALLRRSVRAWRQPVAPQSLILETADTTWRYFHYRAVTSLNRDSLVQACNKYQTLKHQIRFGRVVTSRAQTLQCAVKAGMP